jgi:hypothetical protein
MKPSLGLTPAEIRPNEPVSGLEQSHLLGVDPGWHQHPEAPDPHNALFGLLTPREMIAAMMGRPGDQRAVAPNVQGPAGPASWGAGRTGELRDDHPYVSAVVHIEHSQEHPRARTYITNSPGAVPPLALVLPRCRRPCVGILGRGVRVRARSRSSRTARVTGVGGINRSRPWPAGRVGTATRRPPLPRKRAAHLSRERLAWVEARDRAQ